MAKSYFKKMERYKHVQYDIVQETFLHRLYVIVEYVTDDCQFGCEFNNLFDTLANTYIINKRNTP